MYRVFLWSYIIFKRQSVFVVDRKNNQIKILRLSRSHFVESFFKSGALTNDKRVSIIVIPYQPASIRSLRLQHTRTSGLHDMFLDINGDTLEASIVLKTKADGK